jgi:excisionase family DNA binding protein
MLGKHPIFIHSEHEKLEELAMDNNAIIRNFRKENPLAPDNEYFEPMTPKDAAAYIGCSEYTIRDMARKKKVPHYRIGSKIMFRKSTLDKWIAQQETENYDIELSIDESIALLKHQR